jgi:hypothetical protein
MAIDRLNKINNMKKGEMKSARVIWVKRGMVKWGWWRRLHKKGGVNKEKDVQ